MIVFLHTALAQAPLSLNTFFPMTHHSLQSSSEVDVSCNSTQKACSLSSVSFPLLCSVSLPSLTTPFPLSFLPLCLFLFPVSFPLHPPDIHWHLLLTSFPLSWSLSSCLVTAFPTSPTETIATSQPRDAAIHLAFVLRVSATAGHARGCSNYRYSGRMPLSKTHSQPSGLRAEAVGSCHTTCVFVPPSGAPCSAQGQQDLHAHAPKPTCQTMAGAEEGGA